MLFARRVLLNACIALSKTALIHTMSSCVQCDVIHKKLQVNVNFDNLETVESFTHNKASWHKQCHQKLHNITMLYNAHMK